MSPFIAHNFYARREKGMLLQPEPGKKVVIVNTFLECTGVPHFFRH
jgi:hypothetical protein